MSSGSSALGAGPGFARGGLGTAGLAAVGMGLALAASLAVSCGAGVAATALGAEAAPAAPPEEETGAVS